MKGKNFRRFVCYCSVLTIEHVKHDHLSKEICPTTIVANKLSAWFNPFIHAFNGYVLLMNFRDEENPYFVLKFLKVISVFISYWFVYLLAKDIKLHILACKELFLLYSYVYQPVLGI